MNHPQKISAEFEIVTPMFLGDAEHKATRISEASIKGALVFWWRALNYGKFFRNNGEDNRAALINMHKCEQYLFGGGDCGQSRVLLKVRDCNIRPSIKMCGVLKNRENGLDYLGYGLKDCKHNNCTCRSCFDGGNFSIDLIIRQHGNNCSDQNIDIAEEILPAVQLLGLIGGLGSRVRRGWGSLALKNLTKGDEPLWTEPVDNNSYNNALKDVIGDIKGLANGCHFELTAFASKTDIRIGETIKNNSLECLSDIGIGFQRYRSWKNLNGNRPERAEFGLPYKDYSERRASPLMFHIHKLANGNCFPVASFFPTKFLKNNKISVNKTLSDFDFNADVILNFLNNKHPDGTSAPKGEYFPSKVLFS